MSTYTRNVQALTEQQKAWFKKLNDYPVHILEGPAGSGKTYIATAEGCARLDKGLVDRLVFLRPHVTTEEFGFLPGSLEDKMDPLMVPIIDVALQRLSAKRYNQYIADKKIEIAALAYLRGRTFNNCWIILDEAQNCTITQIKMVLTRLGEGSTLIIAGDSTQSDLKETSGLVWAKKRLTNCPVVSVTEFLQSDVVRSNTVKELLRFIGD